ncbi:hypothetical protein RE429_25600 (plasmid) [Microvirga sp. M2]
MAIEKALIELSIGLRLSFEIQLHRARLATAVLGFEVLKSILGILCFHAKRNEPFIEPFACFVDRVAACSCLVCQVLVSDRIGYFRRLDTVPRQNLDLENVRRPDTTDGKRAPQLFNRRLNIIPACIGICLVMSVRPEDAEKMIFQLPQRSKPETGAFRRGAELGIIDQIQCMRHLPQYIPGSSDLDLRLDCKRIELSVGTARVGCHFHTRRIDHDLRSREIANRPYEQDTDREENAENQKARNDRPLPP